MEEIQVLYVVIKPPQYAKKHRSPPQIQAERIFSMQNFLKMNGFCSHQKLNAKA